MIEPLENFFELDLPILKINSGDYEWKQYNPRKNINRFGASLTSLDGQTSGVPDLDSLFEYNQIHNKNYNEMDFQAETKYFKPFEFLKSHFKIGRSHIIKLGVGGFFPYHRDFNLDTVRLIYTIRNCSKLNLVWIHDNKILEFMDNRWYYVNTSMIHSVFSYWGSEFAVFNILKEEGLRTKLSFLSKIK